MTMPRIRRQCSVSLKTTAARMAAKGTWICTAMAAVAASTFSMPAKIMPKCSTPSVTERPATWSNLPRGNGRRKGESTIATAMKRMPTNRSGGQWPSPILTTAKLMPQATVTTSNPR